RRALQRPRRRHSTHRRTDDHAGMEHGAGRGRHEGAQPRLELRRTRSVRRCILARRRRSPRLGLRTSKAQGTKVVGQRELGRNAAPIAAFRAFSSLPSADVTPKSAALRLLRSVVLGGHIDRRGPPIAPISSPRRWLGAAVLRLTRLTGGCAPPSRRYFARNSRAFSTNCSWYWKIPPWPASG